jgi:DNA-binding NarL/FixJ family response regulator
VKIQFDAHIMHPILRNWYEKTASPLRPFLEIKLHEQFSSLLRSLPQPAQEQDITRIILLDAENDHYPEQLEQLKKTAPFAKLMVIAYPKGLTEVKSLFSKGCNACIDPGIGEAELLQILRHLQHHPYSLSSSQLNELIEDFIEEKPQQLTAQGEAAHKKRISEFTFSDKETETVEYLLKGYSYKKIAQIFGVTSFAINQRAKSIYRKAGVRSRNELSYLLLQ